MIVPGIFWLSNVQEILSFVTIAESDAEQGFGPVFEDEADRDFYWEKYSRLVTIVKQDLDSLEYNIYYTWMLEVKKRLQKMVIPALIESQSLPGFVTSDGTGRMFSRMLQGMQGNNGPTATMDDVLEMLNKVYKCLKSYYMEESVMQQVVTELLKLIGQIAFNDLIMRRNFCSWKRGECGVVVGSKSLFTFSYDWLGTKADRQRCKFSIISRGSKVGLGSARICAWIHHLNDDRS